MSTITSGSMPAVVTGEISVGLFTTDYSGSGVLVGQYSLDGVTWDEGTVLGSNVVNTSGPEVSGFTTFRVYVQPVLIGSVTLYLRTLVEGEFGPVYETVLEAFNPSGGGFIGEFTFDDKSVTPDGVVGMSDGGAVCVLRTNSRGTVAPVLKLNGELIASKPTGVTDGGAFVRVDENGNAIWVRWVSASDGELYGWRLAVDGAGNIFGSRFAESGSLTTGRTSDWQEAWTEEGPTSGGDVLIVSLTTSGDWGPRTMVEGAGVFGGLGDLVAEGSRVVFTTPVRPAAGSISYGGVTDSYAAGSDGDRSAVVCFTSSLTGLWSAVWTRGLMFTSSTIAIDAEGRVLMAAHDPVGVSIGGLSTPIGSGGIVLVSPVGGVVWLAAGSGRFGDHIFGLSLGGAEAVVIRSVLRNSNGFSIGGASASTDDSLWMWKLNMATGAVTALYQLSDSDVTVRSVSATRNGRLLLGLEITAGRAAVLSVTTSGTVEWTAEHDRTFVNFSLAPSGVGYGTASLTNSQPSTVTFTNADGTTQSRTTANSLHGNLMKGFAATLSPTGMWGVGIGGGIPQGPLAPPYGEWPLALQEDDVLSATVLGYDPDATGGDATLQWWNPATGEWSSLEGDGIEYLGGFLTIFQGTLDIGATVTYMPPENFYGVRTFILRWLVDDRPLGGLLRGSAARVFETTWINILEAPDTPTGSMPTILEDTVSVGTWSFVKDPDNLGSYTWSLSPQTSKPDNWDELYPPLEHPDGQPEWHTVTGSTITVIKDGMPVGTATVLSQNDTTRTAEIQFTPYPDWNGTASFAVSVIGSLRSGWTNATVTVEPVDDAPTALIGEAPDIEEDDFAEFVLSWTDPDVDPADGASGYVIQLGLVEFVGGMWQITSWTEAEELNVGNAIIRVLDYSETALEATLRVEGAANQNGVYRFAGRVYEDRPVRLFGPPRIFTANIISVPDAPARIQGAMPMARYGASVEGLFTTDDPDTDDTAWEFQIASSPEGPWLMTLARPGGVTLTVVDNDFTDLQTLVRMDQAEPGATVTQYDFWIRVTDSGGLYSEPARFVGYIGTPSAGIWLQRLVRSSGAATVELLAPLRNLTSLSVTESLDGSGSAEVRVAASEIRRRAKDLGMSPQHLLDAASVELMVTVGGSPLFVGPLTETEWEAGDAEVTITARGLLSYLERRVLNDDVPYVNVDLAAIAADLLVGSQALPFGGLAILDGASIAGQNGTLTFPGGTTIADALGTIAEQVGAPEVWVDPTRELRVSTARGVDRRSRVRITGGMALVSRWTSRSEGVVTVARVTGADNGVGGVYVGTYADEVAMETYGRVESAYAAQLLLSNADCAALAERIVKASAVAAEAVTLDVAVTPQRPFGVDDLGVGDVVTVDVIDRELGQLLGAYRIVNRTVRLVEDGAGSYMVTLDLEPARYVAGRLVGSRSRHNAAVFTQLAAVELRLRQAL